MDVRMCLCENNKNTHLFLFKYNCNRYFLYLVCLAYFYCIIILATQ